MKKYKIYIIQNKTKVLKMESLPKIKKTTSNRNKDMLIGDEKYQFNLINNYKDGTKLFKCKEYKSGFKCPAYIKMKNDQILE